MAEQESTPRSSRKFSDQNGYTEDLDIKSIDGYPPVYVPLSDEEKNKLKTFKSRMEDVHNPKLHYDEYYVRFLRARLWDIDAAEKMFRNSIQWKKDYNVKGVIKKFPKHPHYKLLSKYWPGAIVGYSRDGSAIWLERIGQLEPKSVLEYVSPDSIMKYHICKMEEHERRKRKHFAAHGWSPANVLVQDCKGLGMKHASRSLMNYLSDLTKIDQDIYPETMRKTFFISTPSAFGAIFALVRPFIDERVLQKLEVITSTSHIERLDPFIDKSQLPLCIGGTSEEPFNEGGVLSPPWKDSIVKVNIPAGGHHIVEIETKKPNEELTVYFRTDSHNISFGIEFVASHEHMHSKSEDISKQMIHENTRIDSHEATFTETFVLENVGKYEIRWDNSFSRMRSKDLYYHLWKEEA